MACTGRFEIGVGHSAPAGGAVAIRTPFLATSLYSDATKPHFFYLVKAGLVAAVEVLGVAGLWSQAKAIFKVDASATTTPALTFGETAGGGAGRLVESFAAGAAYVQIRSSGQSQGYTANTLGGTGAVHLGNLGLHRALMHNNGPMAAGAGGDVVLNRLYGAGKSLGWVWNQAAPVVIHAPSVGGGGGWADADRTLTPETDHEEQLASVAITADRSVILAAPPTSAVGYRFRITRTAAGAFNMNVRNLTGAGALLKSLPGNSWGEFLYDGGNWSLRAYGTL